MYNKDVKGVCYMQINRVGMGQHFSGKRENIEAFIGLDDQTVRKMATAKTLQSVDVKKHQKLDTALNWALPVAGGISAATMAAKGSKLKAFGGGFASWALFLTGMGLALGTDKLARQKSDKYNNFTQKHPLISFVLSAGAAFGAGLLAIKGGTKGIKALSKTKAFASVSKSATQLASKVKSNKFVAEVTQKAGNFFAKTPSPLKEAGKFLAKNASWAVILGSFAHSIGFNSKVSSEYAKNYTDLKEKQLHLAKLRNAELTVQNDFLLTDEKNQKDLAAVKLA